ncbi:hypothetical protein FRC11_003317, partial [Ceratobasidium sp. 423]
MPPSHRKRLRPLNDNGSNSSTSPPSSTAGSTAQSVPEAQNTPSSQLSQILAHFRSSVLLLKAALENFGTAENPDEPPPELYSAIAFTLKLQPILLNKLPQYGVVLAKMPSHKQIIADLYNISHTPPIQVEKSVATEPTPELTKPSYSNVGCSTDSIPTPSAQPLDPSPSPKPGPRPHPPPCPKKAHPLTPRPRSHQVRSNVRLVACIAGRPDALTSETPRWKAVPTDCFSTLSKELKTIAPGCTPLSFHCNQKGNLIIAFTPSTPRSLLMSKLTFIRGAFELAHQVPILFDTPRSTIHLAHVQARSQDGSPIFDQSALAESILANPALSALPLISQPRWLRHPSKILGIRSSAVLTFEDPDGAIARQLLNTPIFVFGQPVTVKPWINKPSISTRHPRT